MRMQPDVTPHPTQPHAERVCQHMILNPHHRGSTRQRRLVAAVLVLVVVEIDAALIHALALVAVVADLDVGVVVVAAVPCCDAYWAPEKRRYGTST